MDKIVEIMKAASDPARIRILMALINGELCVCQITELLGLAPSTVSKHISILKHAGFLECRKDAKWIYYKLNEMTEYSSSKKIINLLMNELKITEQFTTDKRRLEKILKENQEILFKKICCKEKNNKTNELERYLL